METLTRASPPGALALLQGPSSAESCPLSTGPRTWGGGEEPPGHLQLPDAPAVGGDAVDSLAHEGDQHVEQQDVGEQHVGQ